MATLRGTEKADRFGIYDGPTEGTDTIFGLGGADIIYGLGGNDHITGGADGDVLFGGAGFDTAYYDDSDARVVIDLRAVTASGGTAAGDLLISFEALVGSRFDDELSGTDENNDLHGGDGDDTLRGYFGNDWFWGGQGGDTIEGGDGYDIAWYTGSDAGVAVDLLTSYAAGGHAARDTLTSVEGLVGSAHADWLAGSDVDNYLYGGDDNDFLFGRFGIDRLYGEGGDDVLDGGAGADFLLGGAGSDTASYETALSRVTASLPGGGGTGDAAGDVYLSIENLTGSQFNDELRGDEGDNTLKGGGGADILFGGDGRDVLFGGEGADRMEGGFGNDVYYVDHPDDFLFEVFRPFDSDVVWVANTSYALLPGSAVEVLGLYDPAAPYAATTFNLFGNEFENTLLGDSGRNALAGGGGTDHLHGGYGGDTLIGDAGHDVFVFLPGQADGDTVVDFSGNGGAEGDTIVLQSYGVGATFAQLDASRWEVTFHGGASRDVITFLAGAAGTIHPADYMFV